MKTVCALSHAMLILAMGNVWPRPFHPEAPWFDGAIVDAPDWSAYAALAEGNWR